MKKKGSFLSGLVVFVLIIIILGGVGYLGFNIISNANGMAGMNMASDTTATITESTDGAGTTNTETTSTETSNQPTTDNNTSTAVAETYKINQLNQMMLNNKALNKAYQTVSSALEKMTLDPYAATDTSSSMSDPMSDQSMGGMQKDTTGDTPRNTTVNIYTGDVTDQQTQMTDMGTTYDADKMQQLHSGLYKVSVGMQLLKQLQNDIALQIEKISVDTGSKTEYYMNQYNKTISNKNKLNNALTYINEAVDLININPYVDANGLVYDSERMTALHDSIYMIAKGVVDLNKLDSDFLTQAVDLGSLAQAAYNESLQSQSTDTMSNMNMTAPVSGINASMIVTFALIAFVVIFLIGLIGSILNLFKSGNQRNITDDYVA